jgi:hypothetical protein
VRGQISVILAADPRNSGRQMPKKQSATVDIFVFSELNELSQNSV